MALVGRKFRVILIGMVAALLVAASPAGAQQNAIVDQYAGEAVCQAVINIIINNTADNESEQDVTAGDNKASNASAQRSTSGDNVVNNEANQEVSTESVNKIAQELNVSPTIVQQCAEEGGVDVDGEDTNGTTDVDGDGIPDNVIQTSIPAGKNLPNTGGLELWAGGVLLLGAGLMMWRMVHRQ